MVIVDTSVWIQALNIASSTERRQLDNLLGGGEAAMVGIVLTEVLHGARTELEFSSLHDRLTAVPYLQEPPAIWAKAGHLSFDLIRQGMKLSVPDVLIAALALEGDHEVYTLDEHFKRVPGLRLYQVKASNSG
jgi:predicted nucleic acid-binding protein